MSWEEKEKKWKGMVGVEIEVHEEGRESEEQSEREESKRGGGKKACVYSAPLHSASNKPRVQEP